MWLTVNMLVDGGDGKIVTMLNKSRSDEIRLFGRLLLDGMFGNAK